MMHPTLGQEGQSPPPPKGTGKGPAKGGKGPPAKGKAKGKEVPVVQCVFGAWVKVVSLFEVT